MKKISHQKPMMIHPCSLVEMKKMSQQKPMMIRPCSMRVMRKMAWLMGKGGPPLKMVLSMMASGGKARFMGKGRGCTPMARHMWVNSHEVILMVMVP
jgi:hypothetical protein